MQLNSFDLVEGGESSSLSGNDLMSAIKHLYCALGIIDIVKKKISKGVFDGVFASSDLATAWFEVNCCRIYTEKYVMIEEYLQPAMGLINDAKCMIDSLVAWRYGLTFYGRISILLCLKEARYAVRTVIEELESWITLNENHDVCESCGMENLGADIFCQT